MITPEVYIQVNDTYLFKGCHSFEIENSVNELSTKGEVVLPLAALYDNVKKKEKVLINDAINEGDTIKIITGYTEDEIYTLFNGFISTIDKDVRITLGVEDAMYKLRQKPYVGEMEATDLLTIIKDIIDGVKDVGISKDTPSIPIDEFKHNGNAAGALATLKEQLSLTIYFDENNNLYAGGQQLENVRNEVKAVYGQNIIKNRTSYKTEESTPLLIEVIGKAEDGTEIPVVQGMDGGNKRTFYLYNITDKETLKKKAEEYHRKYSFTGFEGSIEMFGIPLALPGGSVKYINKNYEDQEGVYFVESVKYKLTKDKGYKQTIKLGARLS